MLVIQSNPFYFFTFCVLISCVVEFNKVMAIEIGTDYPQLSLALTAPVSISKEDRNGGRARQRRTLTTVISVLEQNANGSCTKLTNTRPSCLMFLLYCLCSFFGAHGS
nr:uncharacterized protein LOC112697103 [Arachis hypogaea]